MMYPDLKQDAFNLLTDSEKTEQELDALKHDCALWARDHETSDLIELAKSLKQLERDVIQFECDWNLSGCPMPDKNSKEVCDALHPVFTKLDTLFNDLKKLNDEITVDYIHSTSLQQLEIDWKRFFKTIEKVFG